MSSGRSTSSASPKSGRPNKPQKFVQDIINTLRSRRINTLTELCRIERLAASCDQEVDARAFQEPMTAAWTHYVTSHQFLSELRGLTRNYPFSSELVSEAHLRVTNDPDSNRSWNLAWLCLMKMNNDGLLASFAMHEAAKPEMWGGIQPSNEELMQLARCFEHEWEQAVSRMLRHWTNPPTWY